MYSKAIFTLSKNNAVLLPIWLRYYGKQFGFENMLVLDHQSDDNSTNNLPCNKVVVENPYYSDMEWMTNLQEEYFAKFLEKYDVVVYTDVDELIVPDLRTYDGLSDYIDRMNISVARCAGYEVTHDIDEEPKLDWNKSILKQRSKWCRVPRLDKLLISKVPIKWDWGNHKALSHPDAKIDKDLYLVHLHRIDYETCMTEHRWRKKQNHKWIHKSIGYQDKLDEGAASSFCLGHRGKLSDIPEWIKDAF